MNRIAKHAQAAATISMAEAKAHFAEIVRRAESGERIVVTRHGKPVIEISGSSGTKPSILGMFRGQIKVAEDFDELGPEWDEYIS